MLKLDFFCRFIILVKVVEDGWGGIRLEGYILLGGNI